LLRSRRQCSTRKSILDISSGTLASCHAGSLDVDLATYDPDVEFRGDMTIGPNDGNGLTWTKGDGTLSFTGTANQDVDLYDMSVEDLLIDKSSGTLTFTDGGTTESYTQNDGTVDFNGQTLTSSGDFTILLGAQVVGSGLNGADLTVGGDLALEGQAGSS